MGFHDVLGDEQTQSHTASFSFGGVVFGLHVFELFRRKSVSVIFYDYLNLCVVCLPCDRDKAVSVGQGVHGVPNNILDGAENLNIVALGVASVRSDGQLDIGIFLGSQSFGIFRYFCVAAIY